MSERFNTPIRHFVLFTGGKDSTLILLDLIDYIKDKPEDDIIVINLKCVSLWSGSKVETDKANIVYDKIIEHSNLDESIKSRISYKPIKLSGTNFINYEYSNEYPMNVLVGQTTMLLSVIPTILFKATKFKNLIYHGTLAFDGDDIPHVLEMKKIVDKSVDLIMSYHDIFSETPLYDYCNRNTPRMDLKLVTPLLAWRNEQVTNKLINYYKFKDYIIKDIKPKNDIYYIKKEEDENENNK